MTRWQRRFDNDRPSRRRRKSKSAQAKPEGQQTGDGFNYQFQALAVDPAQKMNTAKTILFAEAAKTR